MATTVAVICLLAMITSVPLIVLKPQWVFYMFLTTAVFGKILYAYIFAAGALGMARTWQPADFLFFSTLFAALFMRKEAHFTSNVVKKCLFIISVLAAICLIQGLVLNKAAYALPGLRRLYFVAAMLFALRYFTEVSRVDGFLKFTSILLIIMFVIHMLLRLGIFVPPPEFQRTVAQLVGGRGELLVVPVLYLALICIAIGRLATKWGTVWFSMVMLFVGLTGIGLAESRTLHGGVVAIGLTSIIFVGGRFRTAVLFAFSLCLVIWIAAIIGLNVMIRWQTGVEATIGRVTVDAWRSAEYSAIVGSYSKQPHFILTGRGVGATHSIPTAEVPQGFVSYYHSEFLGWLDMFGLIGLMCLLIVWIASSYHSFALSRSHVPNLARYGTTVFLSMAALFLHSIFSPSFMNHKSAPVLICLVVIMANWEQIYYNSFREQYEFSVNSNGGHEHYENYQSKIVDYKE